MDIPSAASSKPVALSLGGESHPEYLFVGVSRFSSVLSLFASADIVHCCGRGPNRGENYKHAQFDDLDGF